MIGKIKIGVFHYRSNWTSLECGDWWVNSVEVITPVVNVRDVSDVLLCSGRLGKAVVACLLGTTAIQKDNN